MRRGRRKGVVPLSPSSPPSKSQTFFFGVEGGRFPPPLSLLTSDYFGVWVPSLSSSSSPPPLLLSQVRFLCFFFIIFSFFFVFLFFSLCFGSWSLLRKRGGPLPPSSNPTHRRYPREGSELGEHLL